MDIQSYITAFLDFINDTLIPLLLAIAFFVFIFNIARYFIIGGSNEDSQEKAKSTAIWGIAAFVVMLSIWGIVTIFINVFNLDNRGIVPDYMCDKDKELYNGYCRDKGSTPIDNYGDYNEPSNFDQIENTV